MEGARPSCYVYDHFYGDLYETRIRSVLYMETATLHWSLFWQFRAINMELN